MAEKLEMMSSNIIQENIDYIAEKFPNALKEVMENGKLIKKIDFDVLKQELSAVVIDDKQERYQMTWPDKKKSILLANSRINATLRPIKEKSVDFDNTRNLYIEGDNLDVLKLLRETYLGKIKMIYIDPPYNTGNDFVYEDDFSQTTEDYLPNSGQFDQQGNRLFQNTDSNGRFHTDWLNMIYPRLKIGKDLLTDDGLMLISIGEQEIDNLKKIIIELFTNDNYIETYVWESTFRPDNSSPIMRRNAEYILCVAKSKKNISKLIGEKKDKEGLPSLTKSSMKESTLTFPSNTVKTYLKDGVYKKGIRDSYELLDDVTVKKGIIINSFKLKGKMIWGQNYLNEELMKGTEIIIKGEGFVPYTKKAGDSIMAPTKLVPNYIAGDVLAANAEMAKLFTEKVFSYPKPVSLIKYLINYFEDNEFIFMDFFSGSSTSAQAILESNLEDNGKRRFVMVQLPEDLDSNLAKANPKEKETIQNGIDLCIKLNHEHTICTIAEERIRRAGRKIKDEAGVLGQNLDIGFRVLKLDSSNMNDVYYNPNQLSQNMLDQLVGNVKEDRTPLDLLFQVMLELGIELSAKIEEKELLGKKYFVVNENDIVACFDDGINDELVKELAKIHSIFAVFKDSAFASDSANINCEQIFKSISPSTTIKVV